MLFSTSIQPQVFWLIVITCFLGGFLFDIANLFTRLCSNNAIIKNISLFFAMTIWEFLLLIVVFKYNYGEFRLYCIICALLALFIQRLMFGKIIAKFFDWWYINFEKLKTKLLQRKKSDNKTN